MDLLRLIAPELILIGIACALFLLGVSSKAAARRTAPVLALLALAAAFVVELVRDPSFTTATDPFGAFRITPFTHYVRLLATSISAIFVGESAPSSRRSISVATGPVSGAFMAPI